MFCSLDLNLLQLHLHSHGTVIQYHPLRNVWMLQWRVSRELTSRRLNFDGDVSVSYTVSTYCTKPDWSNRAKKLNETLFNVFASDKATNLQIFWEMEETIRNWWFPDTWDHVTMWHTIWYLVLRYTCGWHKVYTWFGSTKSVLVCTDAFGNLWSWTLWLKCHCHHQNTIKHPNYCIVS